MYVILTYDINKKSVNRVLKVCKDYLIHVQNSVFEGNITESKLKNLKTLLEKIIDVNTDKIAIYKLNSVKYAKKEEIGYSPVINNIL